MLTLKIVSDFTTLAESNDPLNKTVPSAIPRAGTPPVRLMDPPPLKNQFVASLPLKLPVVKFRVALDISKVTPSLARLSSTPVTYLTWMLFHTNDVAQQE